MGFKTDSSTEMPCLHSRWWAACQGGFGWVPAPPARGHGFPGGTAASLLKAKCRGDGWFFSEVLLKGHLCDPVYVVETESF